MLGFFKALPCDAFRDWLSSEEAGGTVPTSFLRLEKQY